MLRFGSIYAVALGVAGLLGLGCGLLERAACGEPCEGGTEPPGGAPEDFTLGGLQDDDATVTEAEVCEAEQDYELFVSHIQTHGADTEVDSSDWLLERLMPMLREGDGPVPGYGLAKCAGAERAPEEDGLVLLVDDWTQVDPVTMAVLDLAREDDVAIEITIAIEPHFILCPQDDCGY